MNYATHNLQMKIAEQLHEYDGCENVGGSRKLEDCTRKEHYITSAALFLGKIMLPLITDIVLPVRKEERERVAQRIEAELVCCDITDRMSAEAEKGRWDDENHTYLMPQSWKDLRKSSAFHPICFYGGWAADIAEAGPGRRYWCPTAGEVELNEGGGFQTCCDNTEAHIVLGPEADGD
jgi:hypothetical protein